MGVRPPSEDDAEPEIIEFGIAAVDAQLTAADVTFPATAETLIQTFGNAEIPYDPAGRTMTLETAIQQAGTQQFKTRQELLNELHPIFEQRREQSTGVIGRLRSLLPF